MIKQLQLLELEREALTKVQKAIIIGNSANAYLRNNKFKRSEKAHVEALEIYRELSKENPSAYLPNVATTLNNLGLLYSSDNRPKDSETAYDEALKIYRALSKENPSTYLPNMAGTLNNLGLLDSSDNRFTDSKKTYDETLKIYRSLSKENPGAFGIDFAITLVMGVELLNKPGEGLKEAREVLTKFKGIPKADNLLSKIERIEN